MRTPYENITTDRQLDQFCGKLAARDWIAFDTEFVSEHTYRPVLCLVQVATAEELAVIDAMTIEDLTPFWRALAAPGHETILHAGRGEVEFSLAAVGGPPAGLLDVQVAAGLVGVEYPAGYGTLVTKLLGESSHKKETRTDWRRRPLSQRQIDYALDDVRHLRPLRDAIYARLAELGRLAWLGEEMTLWQAEIERAFHEERWRRVSGNAALGPRGLAIVRELYAWREGEAQRRNQPVRRVLRDDLIVELARRQSADVKQIRALRGLERGDLARWLGEIAARIQRALDLPDEQCPRRLPRDQMPQLSVIGQLLFAALGSVCRQAQLAPSLVGGANDIRELIVYRTAASGRNVAMTSRQHAEEHGQDARGTQPPKLARGWRAEFVGRLFDDLLAGKTVIRIADPASDSPLVFDES